MEPVLIITGTREVRQSDLRQAGVIRAVFGKSNKPWIRFLSEFYMALLAMLIYTVINKFYSYSV